MSIYQKERSAFSILINEIDNSLFFHPLPYRNTSNMSSKDKSKKKVIKTHFNDIIELLLCYLTKGTSVLVHTMYTEKSLQPNYI